MDYWRKFYIQETPECNGKYKINIYCILSILYDNEMKLIIYVPGNRNYGYCRLHFGYQIIVYNIYIHIILIYYYIYITKTIYTHI